MKENQRILRDTRGEEKGEERDGNTGIATDQKKKKKYV